MRWLCWTAHALSRKARTYGFPASHQEGAKKHERLRVKTETARGSLTIWAMTRALGLCHDPSAPETATGKSLVPFRTYSLSFSSSLRRVEIGSDGEGKAGKERLSEVGETIPTEGEVHGARRPRR